jgi:hypothetical protein
MIDAMSARIKSNSCDKFMLELQEIESKILKACDNGERSITINKHMSVKTLNKLETLGYKVKNWFQYNETGITISW